MDFFGRKCKNSNQNAILYFHSFVPYRMTKIRAMITPEDEILSDREMRIAPFNSAMSKAIKRMRIKKSLQKARLEMGAETNWQDIIDFIMTQQKKRNIPVVSTQ